MTSDPVRDSDDKTMLALLVEDDDGARSSFADLLRAYDVTPVPVKTAEEALREVKASPGFDLVLSDVNLDPTRYRDKSGISLARVIRKLNHDLPIVGYSSAFGEGDLSDEEKNAFSEYYPKGQTGAAEKATYVVHWKTIAAEYRIEREQRARRKLEQLRERYPSAQSNFATLRFLIPTRLGSEGQGGTEELLRHAGYRIRIVERGAQRPVIHEQSDTTLVGPLMFWLKDEDDATIAEVYGYPELYGHGTDEEEAIRSVLLLMDGFFQDFKSGEDLEESQMTQRLRDFLVSVFGRLDAANNP